MIVRNIINPSTSTSTSAPSSTFDISHPGTGKVVHAVERSTPQDISASIDTAAAGLPGWRSTPLNERKAIFTRAAALLKDERSGWAKRMHEANVAETSCSNWWAGEQVSVVPHFIEALVGAADEALAEENVEFHGCKFPSLIFGVGVSWLQQGS